MQAEVELEMHRCSQYWSAPRWESITQSGGGGFEPFVGLAFAFEVGGFAGGLDAVRRGSDQSGHEPPLAFSAALGVQCPHGCPRQQRA